MQVKELVINKEPGLLDGFLEVLCRVAKSRIYPLVEGGGEGSVYAYLDLRSTCSGGVCVSHGIISGRSQVCDQLH